MNTQEERQRRTGPPAARAFLPGLLIEVKKPLQDAGMHPPLIEK